MDLLWLHIWLVVCSIHHAFMSRVARRENYDIIASDKCINCANHGATCTNKGASCCKECRCGSKAKTFYKEKYKEKITKKCVTDKQIRNEQDEARGCRYYVSRGKYTARRDWIKLGNENTLGVIRHLQVIIITKSFVCDLINAQYWNLEEWKPLENKGGLRIAKDKKLRTYVLKFSGKKSKLEGYLVKLDVKCDEPKKNVIYNSCMVFKFDGIKKYDADIGTPIIPPTQPPTTEPFIATTAAKKKATTMMTVTHTTDMSGKKSMLIGIIIGVAAALLLVIVGIVIWCCWRRKRKPSGTRNGTVNNRLLSNGEDPNYQNPNNLPGRQINEVNGSANNLTYLQPVDANALPKSRYGKDNPPPKRSKDPNYDYPDMNLHNMSQRSDYEQPQDGTEKPIYAEVGDLKPDPDYTRPNLVIKPRTGTQIVGVPGYQPPSGPCSDSGDSSIHDGYSSLGVNSQESTIPTYQSLLEANEEGVKPPSPQYAEVVPEAAGSTSPTTASSELVI